MKERHLTCLFVDIQTVFSAVKTTGLCTDFEIGKPRWQTANCLWFFRASSRLVPLMQTSTSRWEASMASEDSPPSRSLELTRTIQRSTKVQTRTIQTFKCEVFSVVKFSVNVKQKDYFNEMLKRKRMHFIFYSKITWLCFGNIDRGNKEELFFGYSLNDEQLLVTLTKTLSFTPQGDAVVRPSWMEQSILCALW